MTSWTDMHPPSPHCPTKFQVSKLWDFCPIVNFNTSDTVNITISGLNLEGTGVSVISSDQPYI